MWEVDFEGKARTIKSVSFPYLNNAIHFLNAQNKLYMLVFQIKIIAWEY